MSQTLYSHALRIFACAKCGAPVDASVEGGSFTCGYCGAVCQLGRRDESADLQAASVGRSAAISESERYTRLRQQDRQPAPLPDAVAGFTVSGHLDPLKVAAAEAAWVDARSQLAITSSVPVCERFFHLTVLLSPHFEERRRRAALETATEVLPDDGHRHILRCMLARQAARAGDFAAAQAWLAPVNPRSSDLEQDTAYRFAAGTLASARKDYSKVTELLGFTKDDVPLADHDEVACHLLRVDALDHLGREAQALDEMRAFVGKWGVERMQNALARHRPLVICERPFAAAAAQAGEAERGRQLQSLQSQIAALETQQQRLDPPLGRLFSQFVIGSVVIGVLFASLWTCTVSGMAEQDPLFGGHARVWCQHVCDDCHHPYQIVSWTTTTNNSSQNTTTNVYCSDRGGRMESMAGIALWNDVVRGAPWLSRYEVSGGVWFLWLTMILLFGPVGMVVTFSLKLRGWFRRRDQRAGIQTKIDQLRAQLSAT